MKRNRIAPKPTTPPKAADSWVNSGGIDPEVQPSEPISVEEQKTPVVQEPQGKPFPHRISFDTTKEQYKRLKKAAFDEERSLNEIIREAVEDWLSNH